MAVSNVDYYLNRIRSKVTSVAAQVSNALPGNPVTRDHEVFLQVASAGPMLSWKVYSAQKRSTKKVCKFLCQSSLQVFVFVAQSLVCNYSLSVSTVQTLLSAKKSKNSSESILTYSSACLENVIFQIFSLHRRRNLLLNSSSAQVKIVS